MANEIQTIKASQLEELTEVTDSNYIVVTDGATSKKVKATNLKGNSLTSEQAQQLRTAYAHSQTAHVQSSDIPTRTSQLTNDSNFATETYVTNAINNAQLGSGGNSGLTSEQVQQLNTAYTHSQSLHVNSEDLSNINSAVNLNSEKISELNSQMDTFAKKDDVAKISSGTPIFANSIDEMIDNTKNYVNLADGFIYIFNSGNFEKSNLKYQELGLSNNQVTLNNLSKSIQSNFILRDYAIRYETLEKNKYVYRSNDSLLVGSEDGFSYKKINVKDYDLVKVNYNVVENKIPASQSEVKQNTSNKSNNKQSIKKKNYNNFKKNNNPKANTLDKKDTTK